MSKDPQAPWYDSNFMRACRRQPVDVTPVWMMRQAGRYLPEYLRVRKQAGSFMNLCTNPELACEVTMQPLERFPLDAAILFSDILTIPDAMGLGLYFAEGEGPRFEKPVRSKANVEALGVPDPEDSLRYVMDAVRLIRRTLDNRVPLIGFSGSPWTLATYMVEGSSTKTFSQVKGMLYSEPRLMHQLLETVAASVTSYLNAQIAAGAQAVMIFDTWGGLLAPHDFERYILPYVKQLIDGLDRDGVPVIYFVKGGGGMLEIVKDIAAGRAQPEQLTLLEDLAETVCETSLCALGKTAPNPVMSTLQYFREEYEAHIQEQRCPAGVCRSLIRFEIDDTLCKGCQACLKSCPQNAITGDPKSTHVIDTESCRRCGVCVDACKFDAILVA